MANPEHVAIVNKGAEVLKLWRKDYPQIKLDLHDADLRNAVLRSAVLCHVDLRGADLSGADLRDVDLRDAHLRNATLSGADLSGAILSNANLICSILHDANLSDADLSAIQALGTRFQQATLTGACIQDWNINSETNLKGTICEYVFLKQGGPRYRERSPSSGNFDQGDFAKLVQKSISTVHLLFRNGINWEAFAHSFQKLQIQTSSDELDIQAIENKGDGDFVIRVNTPPIADKAKIQEFLMEEYDKELKTIQEKYRAQLQAKNEQIEQYNQENTNLWEITKLLASKPLGPIDISLKKEKSMQLTDERRKILSTIASNETEPKSSNEIATELGMNLNEVVYHMQELARINCLKCIDANDYQSDGKKIVAFITPKGVVAAKTPEKILQSDNSNVQIRNYDQRGARFNNGFIETNYGNQIGTQYNYAPEKQDLAEAAADIQELLKQLEENNPTATDIEKRTFISMGIGPTKKQRLINAVKSGGKAAIEEFLDNPYLNVAIAIIEGWKEAESE